VTINLDGCTLTIGAGGVIVAVAPAGAAHDAQLAQLNELKAELELYLADDQVSRPRRQNICLALFKEYDNLDSSGFSAANAQLAAAMNYVRLVSGYEYDVNCQPLHYGNPVPKRAMGTVLSMDARVAVSHWPVLYCLERGWMEYETEANEVPPSEGLAEPKPVSFGGKTSRFDVETFQWFFAWSGLVYCNLDELDTGLRGASYAQTLLGYYPKGISDVEIGRWAKVNSAYAAGKFAFLPGKGVYLNLNPTLYPVPNDSSLLKSSVVSPSGGLWFTKQMLGEIAPLFMPTPKESDITELTGKQNVVGDPIIGPNCGGDGISVRIGAANLLVAPPGCYYRNTRIPVYAQIQDVTFGKMANLEEPVFVADADLFSVTVGVVKNEAGIETAYTHGVGMGTVLDLNMPDGTERPWVAGLSAFTKESQTKYFMRVVTPSMGYSDVASTATIDLVEEAAAFYQ
jgi:hypothetical protein